MIDRSSITIDAVLFDLGDTLLGRDASVLAFARNQHCWHQHALGHGPLSAYVEAQENWLHLFRLTTATEMDDLREEVRDVRNQIEALSSQLEVVIEALEKNRAQAQGAEAPRANVHGSAAADRPS